MRYVAKLLKGVSSLLSFSLVFCALIIQQAYAAECNPACPNGCNPDGTCKIVDVPMVEDPVVDEDSPSWGDLDDQTQSSVARNQVRFDATGGDEAAQEVYDQQQSRRDQQSANQSTYDNTVSDIQKNLEEQKAKNNERVKNMEQLTQQAQKDYEDAQKRLQSATTPEEMKAANEALKQAKENLEKAKDAQKEVEKEVKKENKALEKEAKSDTKAAEKALKEQQKALEKEQKAQQHARVFESRHGKRAHGTQRGNHYCHSPCQPRLYRSVTQYDRREQPDTVANRARHPLSYLAYYFKYHKRNYQFTEYPESHVTPAIRHRHHQPQRQKPCAGIHCGCENRRKVKRY